MLEKRLGEVDKRESQRDRKEVDQMRGQYQEEINSLKRDKTALHTELNELQLMLQRHKIETQGLRENTLSEVSQQTSQSIKLLQFDMEGKNKKIAAMQGNINNLEIEIGSL